MPEIIAAGSKDRTKSLLVGYYRTEPGETLRLNEKDLALADTYFGKPYQVFLLLQRNGYGAPNATFFFQDENRRMAEFAFLEFPFDPSLLATEERDRIRRSQLAASVAPAESATRRAESTSQAEGPLAQSDLGDLRPGTAFCGKVDR